MRAKTSDFARLLIRAFANIGKYNTTDALRACEEKHDSVVIQCRAKHRMTFCRAQIIALCAAFNIASAAWVIAQFEFGSQELRNPGAPGQNFLSSK
jgi:hypothetical protein